MEVIDDNSTVSSSANQMLIWEHLQLPTLWLEHARRPAENQLNSEQQEMQLQTADSILIAHWSVL